LRFDGLQADQEGADLSGGHRQRKAARTAQPTQPAKKPAPASNVLLRSSLQPRRMFLRPPHSPGGLVFGLAPCCQPALPAGRRGCGAKVVAHGRYIVFQMAEVAVPQDLFGRILDQIDRLRAQTLARC